jgi:hypothetical protein
MINARVETMMRMMIKILGEESSACISFDD